MDQDFFTPLQSEIIDNFRQWLESHEIDTSSLNDIEMWGRIAIIQETGKNTGKDLVDVLDNSSDRFFRL